MKMTSYTHGKPRFLQSRGQSATSKEIQINRQLENPISAVQDKQAIKSEKPFWRRLKFGEWLSAIIIGVVLGIVDMYIKFRASETCTDLPKSVCELRVTFVEAIFFGVLAIGCILVAAFLVKNMSDRLLVVMAERDVFERQHEERGLALDQAIADRSGLQYSIAPCFGGLAKEIWAFESSARILSNSLFNYKLSNGATKLPCQDEWNSLGDQYEELLKLICETAVQIFSITKPSGSPKCCANIKILDGGDVTDPSANLVCKSGSYIDNQKRFDDLKRLNPIRVRSHYLYSTILQQLEMVKNQDGNNKDDVFCLVPDIEVTLRELRANTILSNTYTEPRANGGYTSCLIVPLMTLDDATAQTQSRAPPEVGAIGLLCVDSIESNFFNSDHDLHILKQLAYHAAMTVKNHRNLVALATALKQHG